MEALRLYGKRFLLDLVSQLERHSVGQDQLDSVKFRLDWFLGVLSRYTQAKPDVDIPVNSVIEKLRYAQNIIVQLDKDVYSGYKPEKVYSGCKGRPSFDIPKDQLEMFLEYNFSVPQIAEMLGVSLSTIKRRFRDYDLSVSQTYSAIGDNELDEIIQQLVSEFPNCGYRRMTGFLRGRGIHVQQFRLRESMRRSDPEGVLLRALQLTPVSRRVYNVKSPLALWHMDGHHKLIRYVLCFLFLHT